MFTINWNYPLYDVEFEIGDESYNAIDDAHKSISTALADWLTTDHGDLYTILTGFITIKDSDCDVVFEKLIDRMRLNRDIPDDARLMKILNEHPQNVDETAIIIEKMTTPEITDPLSMMKLLDPLFIAELKAA